MQQRSCSLGCIILLLGLLLSCCLLPYLASSVYSVTSSVLQTPAAPNWLWGDWLGTIVDVDSGLYMILAEGPICCVGTIGLLIVILGLLLAISGMGRREEYDPELYTGMEDQYQDSATDEWLDSP
ncbi:hypothetical protein ACFLTC_00250 [Chloroflexota bacterium]